MSSVPCEVLRDVLQPLNRWTLDGVQLTDRRLLRLITKRMSDVCLRHVRFASVGGLTKHNGKTDVTSTIHFIDRPERNISNYYEDAPPLFSKLMQALRSSCIETLMIGWLTLTPELAALVLQTPMVVHKLKMDDVSCAELTPVQFQEVILHFSPALLDVGSRRLRACLLTDDFIRALSKKASRISFGNGAPVDGGSFHVTDDAVVDFCAQQDVANGEAGDHTSEWKPYAELIFYHGRFTKDLFRRLVEASTASMRSQTLRIVVCPIPRIRDDDLQRFGEHVSYRKHNEWEDLRVYDFPDEQNGMHLQIKLKFEPANSKWKPGNYAGNSLVMVRAQRPNCFFYEPHE
ncbi:hypothetical protein AAVH_06796 [Aphelenchoides avenae]|nr:hypothetical protein AAVH_06796 [Aphelenchus avenae]